MSAKVIFKIGQHVVLTTDQGCDIPNQVLGQVAKIVNRVGKYEYDLYCPSFGYFNAAYYHIVGLSNQPLPHDFCRLPTGEFGYVYNIEGSVAQVGTAGDISQALPLADLVLYELPGWYDKFITWFGFIAFGCNCFGPCSCGNKVANSCFAPILQWLVCHMPKYQGLVALRYI